MHCNDSKPKIRICYEKKETEKYEIIANQQFSGKHRAVWSAAPSAPVAGTPVNVSFLAFSSPLSCLVP